MEGAEMKARKSLLPASPVCHTPLPSNPTGDMSNPGWTQRVPRTTSSFHAHISLTIQELPKEGLQLHSQNLTSTLYPIFTRNKKTITQEEKQAKYIFTLTKSFFKGLKISPFLFRKKNNVTLILHTSI